MFHVKFTVFWAMMCNQIDICQHFRGTCSFNFEGGEIILLWDGGYVFLRNSGPSLPGNSMWHHITVVSTLNKCRCDPISAVSVFCSSLWPRKNWKTKEIKVL
jgi:hypothetical protein